MHGILRTLLTTACFATFASQAAAQGHAGHYPLSDWIPPGTAGSWWTTADPAIQYYPQHVRVNAPEGVMVSLAAEGGFEEGEPAPRLAELAVGATYRLRLGSIPLREKLFLYPTVEVLDRLHPPAGREAEFPIPIEITRDDLAAALAGDYVVKVVYLEAPETAEPIDYREQPLRETSSEEDALETADVLGRPVAILRLGGRTTAPASEEAFAAFAFGYPQWRPAVHYEADDEQSPQPAGVDSDDDSLARAAPRRSILSGVFSR